MLEINIMKTRTYTQLAVVVALGCLAFPQPTLAAHFYTVTSTVDNTDSATHGGAGTLASPYQMSSLRGAIIAANVDSGSTITLPLNTYKLTLGAADSLPGSIVATSGDLDITTPLTINAQGSTIDANNIDRAFDIENAAATNFTVTIDSAIIKNGKVQGWFAHGGGISVRAATLNLTNCTITSNQAVVSGVIPAGNGGGIAANSVGFSPEKLATLSLTNCTVSSNSAGNGGGIDCAGCALTISGSNISGNTASSVAGGGGLLIVDSSSTANITTSNIINNSAGAATGSGSAGFIFGAGSITASTNRIYNNTTAANASGKVLTNYEATVNAINNWWALNTTPAALIAAGTPAVSFSPWLVLSVSASPTAVGPSGTSTVTADLTKNSNNAIIGPATIPNGVNVAFGATLGAMSPLNSSTSSGKASSTFTAGATTGNGTGSATVDGVTASASITIGAVPVINSVTVGPTPAAVGDPVSVTVNVTPATTLSGVTANGTALTNLGSNNWAGIIPAVNPLGSHTVTVVATDSNSLTATNATKSYVTGRIVTINDRTAKDAVTGVGSSNFLFAAAGKVAVTDANTFTIDDGSFNLVKVLATGHGLSSGQMIWARGVLNTAVNPPTLTSAPQWLNYLLAGSALKFDGVDDYLKISNFGAVAPTTEVTVELWSKPDAAQQQFDFILNADNLTNRFSAHIPWSDGTVYWDFGNETTSGRLTYTPPPSSPVAGSWQHFALVASQSGNVMKIFRNGQLVASKVGMTPFVQSAGRDLLIGSSGLLGGSNYAGQMDEIRIWNVARSDAQILANWNKSLTVPQTGLIAYWRFDEGTGTTVFDSTANHRDGTLFNGPTWVHSFAGIMP